MQKTPCQDFSLDHTINSGQFFYFFKEEDYYVIIQGRDIFKVKQVKDELYFKGVTEDKIRDFFQLDFNLETLKHPSLDSQSLKALNQFWGLRIIKQDLWQCIIGFVCSAAANIDKIKMNIRLISKYFGEEIVFDGKTYYLFPQPGSLNIESLLKEAKTGYRSKYLFQINDMILKNPNLLQEIEGTQGSQALNLLTTLPGVGSKVANCISLFALQDYDSFPVDTWVAKIMLKYYIQNKDLSPKQIEKEIESFFPKGNFRGIIQQYLFHYERNLKN